jgi:hypothetical protein
MIPQKSPPLYVLHLGFLKKLLGVKKGTDTHRQKFPGSVEMRLKRLKHG